MPWTLPGEKAGIRTPGKPPQEPLGRTMRYVQSIYDYKVYDVGGSFITLNPRNGHRIGESFPSASAAVKAVVETYQAKGWARGANPDTRPLDVSRPLGYFTTRRTST